MKDKKVHANAARSKFASVKNKKHILKSKVEKIDKFGTLMEVRVWFRVAGKKGFCTFPNVWKRGKVLSQFQPQPPLHYTTLRYATLRYTTLHFKNNSMPLPNSQYNYTTLR